MHGSMPMLLRTNPYIRQNKNRPTIDQAGAIAAVSRSDVQWHRDQTADLGGKFTQTFHWRLCGRRHTGHPWQEVWCSLLFSGPWISKQPWFIITGLCPRSLLNRMGAWWSKARRWALQPERPRLRRVRGGAVLRGELDNTGKPLNSFVGLASIQVCEPCPTQSAAIVTVRMLQQLCVRLHCYTPIRSPSPSLDPTHSLFTSFLVPRSYNSLAALWRSSLY